MNLSFSGARVNDVLDRQIPALAGLAVAPELVTVLIGSNDIIKRDLRARLPERYRAMPLHFTAGPRAPDHFHPDDAGYAAIAADFTTAILARQ